MDAFQYFYDNGSRKEAFCLAPTDPINLLVKSANWKPGSTGLGSACGGKRALSITETLDVGWGDTYSQSLPGQLFDITGRPNGTYYIEVRANPDDRLYEGQTNNNVSLRKVIPRWYARSPHRAGSSLP